MWCIKCAILFLQLPEWHSRYCWCSINNLQDGQSGKVTVLYVQTYLQILKYKHRTKILVMDWWTIARVWHAFAWHDIFVDERILRITVFVMSCWPCKIITFSPLISFKMSRYRAFFGIGHCTGNSDCVCSIWHRSDYQSHWFDPDSSSKFEWGWKGSSWALRFDRLLSHLH